jgi:hypothetical protein
MSELNFVCPPAPTDKRKYISDLGKILVKDYGKKKYYKPTEVKKAHKKSEWSILTLVVVNFEMKAATAHI